MGAMGSGQSDFTGFIMILAFFSPVITFIFMLLRQAYYSTFATENGADLSWLPRLMFDRNEEADNKLTELQSIFDAELITYRELHTERDRLLELRGQQVDDLISQYE